MEFLPFDELAPVVVEEDEGLRFVVGEGDFPLLIDPLYPFAVESVVLTGREFAALS